MDRGVLGAREELHIHLLVLVPLVEPEVPTNPQVLEALVIQGIREAWMVLVSPKMLVDQTLPVARNPVGLVKLPTQMVAFPRMALSTLSTQLDQHIHPLLGSTQAAASRLDLKCLLLASTRTPQALNMS